MKLWKELHGTDATRAAGGSSTSMKIINISLAFTGLDMMEPGQQGIEDFFKLGNEVVSPLPSRKRTRETFEATLSHEAATPKQAGTGQKQCRTLPEETDGSSTLMLSWECPRCRSSLPIVVRPNEVEGERVDIIRSEHEDWHFAKDLARENAVVLGRGGPLRARPIGKKKRKKESVDIASYFKKN
jgi:DNA polymerase eta